MKKIKSNRVLRVLKISEWIMISLSFLVSGSSSTLVQMRVVKETANYGYFQNNIGLESSNQLVASVLPTNFSGPVLLNRLNRKCYNLTQDRYRYTFCPFQNFTQYEISQRWNAYQGILGIWSHWDIRNNSFSAMVFKNGDVCGDVDRSVKVFLECGSNETLLNVTEPDKCQYSAIFNTRYVCHPDALLVYPRLDIKLQKEWDKVLTDFHHGTITEKGYQAGLEKIFHTAGFFEITANLSTSPSKVVPTVDIPGDSRIFTDLLACNKEYKTLKDEVQKLKEELDALKVMVDLDNAKSRHITSQTKNE